MHRYLPQNFFDLNECPFRDLFLEELPVWETLKNISSWLKRQQLGRLEGEIAEGAYLVHPELIYLGKGSVVEPGAYLRGPLWIGENVTIRHGAYLRGEVVVAPKAVVGHDTEVKGSIFLAGAQAAHFAYVGDSILGQRVNLGAGTKLANLKLNHQEVKIEGVGTGLKKMGSMVGDGCSVGCNSVLNPGVILGKGVDVYPLTNVSGVIPSENVVCYNHSIVLRAKKG